MLENLKKRPSPLLHNADLTENTRYPLENLTSIGPEFLLGSNIKPLLRAWHGLFGSLINETDILLTIDKPVLNCLTEEWETLCNTSVKPDVISFKSPLFKKDKTGGDESRNDMMIGDDIQNIVNSNIKKQDKIEELKKLTGKFESMFGTETGADHILFSILLFQAPEKPDLLKNDPFLDFISGRTLVFAELNG